MLIRCVPLHPQALRQSGKKAHPRDYLNFFCPAKREIKHPDEPEPAKPPPKDSDQVRGKGMFKPQDCRHSTGTEIA